MLKPWTILSNRTVYRMGTVEMQEEICQHPRTGLQAPFFRLQFLDWVNTVPVTPQGEVVLVRQFRKGVHDFTLEIPGGTMDAGEQDHAAAALREMAEETGYTADRVTYLGWVHANPAIQNNRCHFYLAENASLTQDTHWDKWEELEVVKMPWAEVKERIEAGEIAHSLGVLGLLKAAAHLGVAWGGTALFR